MAKPADYLLPLGMGVCNSWRIHWDFSAELDARGLPAGVFGI